MDLSFDSIIVLLADNFFGGSLTLAGLALMLAAWAICVVLCMNLRAPPIYSIVPMIPLSIFFAAYGVLNETVMILIILVTSVIVAAEFKRVV